ncbi:MAG: hypothetical protein H6R00_44 [Proteobacteria bacterium]|nr:hypothetical protein [Pseudomonadota bacterium]
MAKPVAEWTDSELQNIIDNYRRKALTSDPYYLQALEDMGRRKGGGLDFDKTLHAVLKAARAGNYLSYGQLAQESGVDWAKKRYAMTSHLAGLLEFSHRKGWPLIGAIIVNQQKLKSGEMDPATRKGFATAATDLGYAVVDDVTFMRDQQQAVFDWAKSFQETPAVAMPADAC